LPLLRLDNRPKNDDAADDKTAGNAAIAQWEQTQKHGTVSTKDI
tara:strand:+ start:31544 stop:31675 length:132 start_codon:yes stop_codon:yes gene_type:complete